MNEDSTDADIDFVSLGPLDENIHNITNTSHSRKIPQLDRSRQLLPVFVFTAIFGLIFIIGPLLVRRGPNSSIIKVCIMLSTVCCWIFWTTTYIVQMNPLLGPRLSNHSLAWIGHKWGKSPADLSNQPNILSNTTTNTDIDTSTEESIATTTPTG